MAFPKAIEAAKSSLLQLSASDQESLLAVAVDYFTSPCSQEEDSDQEDETEMELDVEPGTYIHTHKKKTKKKLLLIA